MTGLPWAQIIGLIFAMGTPYAVGFLTKSSWPRQIKGTLLAVLSLVNGVLVDVFGPTPENDLRNILTSALLAFVTSHVGYQALLKGTASMQAVQRSGVTDRPSGAGTIELD